MKRIAGWYSAAAAKTALTIFSLSPCHLEPMLDAERQRKVARSCEAAALASSVVPVPGGPRTSERRCVSATSTAARCESLRRPSGSGDAALSVLLGFGAVARDAIGPRLVARAEEGGQNDGDHISANPRHHDDPPLHAT
jgi:hypothetical protein